MFYIKLQPLNHAENSLIERLKYYLHRGSSCQLCGNPMAATSKLGYSTNKSRSLSLNVLLGLIMSSKYVIMHNT